MQRPKRKELQREAAQVRRKRIARMGKLVGVT